MNPKIVSGSWLRYKVCQDLSFAQNFVLLFYDSEVNIQTKNTGNDGPCSVAPSSIRPR